MYVEGCNIKFFKNDTPNIGQLVPNFIHSLDATALRYVCKKLLDQGHDVFPIHDCVIISEELTQDYISSLFREAYQFIADYYNCDVVVDGMVLFPE
jgi:DNA-directed RNA polymerase